jgi:hypothetical protein
MTTAHAGTAVPSATATATGGNNAVCKACSTAADIRTAAAAGTIAGTLATAVVSTSVRAGCTAHVNGEHFAGRYANRSLNATTQTTGV